MSAKKNKSNININGEQLYSAIRRAYIDGIILDAVLEIKDKVGTIQAFNLSQNVFVHVSFKVPFKDQTLGLGDLGVFYNYIKINKDREIQIKINDNRMTCSVKKHGKLMYLLTEPASIGSALDSDNDTPTLKKILKGYSAHLSLNQKMITDIKEYTSLTKPTSIKIEVNKKGTVILSAGMESDHKFVLKLGSIVYDKHCPQESISVLTDDLLSILNILEWADKEPQILIGDGKPLIIKQDETNLWILKPIIMDNEDVPL